MRHINKDTSKVMRPTHLSKEACLNKSLVAHLVGGDAKREREREREGEQNSEGEWWFTYKLKAIKKMIFEIKKM